MAPSPNGNDGLYPAERKFLDHLKSGRPCRHGKDPSRILPRPKEPVYSRDPNVANVIRGDVIRHFLVGKNAIQPPKGLVELSGYWIEGRIDFYFASIPMGLVFCNCHFDSEVNLAFAETRSIALSGSRLCEGIVFNGTVICGNLNMNCGDEKTGKEAFVSDQDVQLMGVHVSGDLTCSGGQFKACNKAALLADRAKIDGDVMANDNFSADGDVRFLGAHIGGAFNCVDGKITAREDTALVLADARIDRSVMINNFCFKNQLLKGKGCAIAADGLHVGGSFFLRKSHLIGEARFSLVKIDGDFDFTGSMFHGETFALSARGANVGGNVLISDEMSSYGVVDISGMNIKLGLYFVDANIKVETGDAPPSKVIAILAEHVKVGNAMLWRQMSGNGVVNLASSSVDTFSDDIDAWNGFTIVLDDFSYRKFVDADVTADSRRHWLSKQRWFSPKPYEQVAKILFGMGHAHDAREILLEKERLQTAEKRTPVSHKIMRWLWDVFAGYGYRLHYTAAWMAAFVAVGGVFFWSAAHHDQIVPHQPAILASEKYQIALKENSPMEAVQCAFPDEYPEFSPLAFSFDVFIPLFALHQEPFWAPASGGSDTLWMLLFPPGLFLILLGIVVLFAWLFRYWRKVWKDSVFTASAAAGMAVVSLEIAVAAVVGVAHVLFGAESVLWLADGQRLTIWYWMEIGAGWILTSLFLLSVTGLLRPRQSSGERD